MSDDSEKRAAPMRPMSELRSEGILWAINRFIFHPRGYAMAFHIEENEVELLGWSMMGQGDEVWGYERADDDQGFAQFMAFLNSLPKKDLPCLNQS